VARLSIVHAAKFYPPIPGGMESVVADLCAGTAADWDVRVVSSNDVRKTVHEQIEGVHVVRVASFGVRHSVPLCPEYPFQLWRRQADCVILHEPNPVAGTSVFLRSPGRRLIVWHHSDLLKPSWAPATYGRLQRSLYRRADCVIVSSPNLAAHSPLVASARRVAVVPFGVSLERFQTQDPTNAAHTAALKLSAAGPLFLFVGRLVYYKGLEVLIDAMAQCRGTLLIVGDGPLEDALRERASARGVSGRVRFLGRVPAETLPAVYQAADVFVLPSVAFTETFGVAQVEAMAAGLPVISTNLPTGVPWVNQHGVSGLVVEPGDVEGLAAAMRRLGRDAGERTRLGEGAVTRATSHFSRARMLTSFKNIVEQLVEQPVRVPALAGTDPA